MRDHILFQINGRELQVRGRDVYTTLSNFLRYGLCATGTKVVCEEGDCGACTVLIRRSRDDDYRAVNSCIQALHQLDGASIVTVEGLREDGELSAVQQAMVTCHGAQCGYCTPGFVVAMTALFEHADRVDEKQVRDGLTGNLCRCTGYEPIIKAALAVERPTRIRDRYPNLPDAGDDVQTDSFFAPTSLDDAIRWKGEHPGCTIVQGGTDVGVWVNKRGFTAPAVLSLAKLRDLDELREDDGAVVAGANVTLADFERFIETRIPELFRILNIFGAPQIKNAGTLVGNIANGSPIGDTLPYLIVAGAELELNGGARRVAIADFYKGYKQFDLAADEIITRVRVPIVSDVVRLYKVSRRKDLDISAFTAAFRLTMADGTISASRIAYGGVGPVVLRLPKTEAFLAGKKPSLELFTEAGAIARGEVTPISDVRGSKDYRLQLAENITQRFWYDAFEEATR